MRYGVAAADQTASWNSLGNGYGIAVVEDTGSALRNMTDTQ